MSVPAGCGPPPLLPVQLRGQNRRDGGAGVGLAIVRALADAMGGQAWAESGGPGTGATFLLELPSHPA